MCDIVSELPSHADCPIFFEEQAETSDVGRNISAVLCTTTKAKTDDIDDALGDDGVSLVATIDTHEYSPSSAGGAQCVCEGLEEPSVLHFDRMYSEGQHQQHQKGEISNVKTVFSSWMSYAPAPVITSADMAPTLLASFLLYSEELFAVTHTKSSMLQRKKAGECDQEVPSVCGMCDFLRLRLSPSGNSPSPQGIPALEQRKRSCLALSWFLQHHCELSATVMSMSFDFLLGLEERGLSWKKAVEVPLTTLQLVASYAHTLTFYKEGNIFDTLSPRDHLIIMAASLLACWKCTDLDANVAALISILDNSFFLHHRVLNVKEVLHLESVVLSLCGLHVEAPRWWRVAIEILTGAYGEEEAVLDVSVKSHTCCPHTSGTLTHLRCRYEEKLEKLLLTSQRVLLFVMNMAAMDEVDETRKTGSRQTTTASNNRVCERRGVLCCWMESSPLFGVALAVASGAVELEWAAFHIGPTAGMCSSNNMTQNAIRDADAAAQREMSVMVDVLREVLCLLMEQTQEHLLHR